MTTEADEDRIYQQRLLGRTPRTIAVEFGISVAEVETVVDRKMVVLDNAYRVRAVRLELERIDALQARVLREALSGDLAAGHLWLRLAERKAAMLGTDAPVCIDAVQVQNIVEHRETSTDKIERALNALISQRNGNGSPSH